MKHKRSISEFEKNEITKSTFKRNKIYLDMNKIDHNEKQQQIKRRSPNFLLQSPKSSMVNKNISKNFRYSVDQLNNKLGQEMIKFKNRVSPERTKQSFYAGESINGPYSQRIFINTNYNQKGIFKPRKQPFNSNQVHDQYNDEILNQEKDLNPQKLQSQTSRRQQFSLKQKPKISFRVPGNRRSLPMTSASQYQLTNSQLTLHPPENQSVLSTKVKCIIPIDKQITRQYLHKYKFTKHLAPDQRNFNNFYITKHDLSKTQDFKKLSPRNISFVNENINDINYQGTQGKYQKFYFSTKDMKAHFRYKVQNSKEGRKFFVPQDPSSIAKTALDPAKIHKSFTQSNFKPNKIDNFYKMTGRQYPHQLDQRLYSPNKNYYKNKQGRLQKQQVDYSIKKLYDDLVRKQKEQQHKKKNPQFTRNQICDIRYFQEMIKKENKMKEVKKISVESQVEGQA